MSQPEDTLREKLRQQLRKLKEDGEADWLRELMEWVLQELLELEFTEFLRAEPYERSEERRGYRNGHRSRELYTRVGTLTLRIPRDREGRFSTEIFARYQRSEKALVLALQEISFRGSPPAGCAGSRRSSVGRNSARTRSRGWPKP